MIVNLAKVKEDKTHFNKTYESVTPKNVTFLMPYNMVTPRISLTFASELLDLNYCGVTMNNKTYYYYIVDKTIDKHDLILQLDMDRLATYKTEILNCRGHITRSNYGNKFIKDNLATQLENPIYSYKTLGKVFNSGLTHIMVKGK